MADEKRDQRAGRPATGAADRAGAPRYVRVHDLRPDDYDGTCLRPLGLCELGGCCEVCWYRPTHPRFAKNKPGAG